MIREMLEYDWILSVFQIDVHITIENMDTVNHKSVNTYKISYFITLKLIANVFEYTIAFFCWWRFSEVWY